MAYSSLILIEILKLSHIVCSKLLEFHDCIQENNISFQHT